MKTTVHRWSVWNEAHLPTQAKKTVLPLKVQIQNVHKHTYRKHCRIYTSTDSIISTAIQITDESYLTVIIITYILMIFFIMSFKGKNLKQK